MADIRFAVNGKEVDVGGDPERTLLEVLREDLGLTGTKYGCGERACGACSVIVGGKRVFSCQTKMKAMGVKEVTTI